MTSTRDVQDMLGLALPSGPKPKAAKKKGGPKVPKGEGGWNKEIRSLIGERAPPAHLLEAQPKFQKKRAVVKSGPVRRWHFKQFHNDARTDGLLFRHWRRTELESKPFSRDGEVVEIADEEQEKPTSELESAEGPEYKFGSKYNPSVEVPMFDAETYEKSLQNDDWTEEETRYLLDCYKDHFGKWAVVWDRYDWDRNGPSTASNASSIPSQSQAQGETQTSDAMEVDDDLVQHTSENGGDEQKVDSQDSDAKAETKPPRTMEDLKHRFYAVSAALLALATPPTQMTASQYRLHEQMTRYNPATELQRKKAKEVQMTRSKEEKREEEFLLAELQRIYFGQERVDTELRELRGRLDHSLTDDKNPSMQYTSSKELQDVFNRFIRKENMARPAGMSAAQGGPRRSLAGQSDLAGSAGSPTGSVAPGNKKGGIASTTEEAAPSVRQLTPRSAAKNGVTNHERLTSGVTFRSDRITKIRQPSKSAQVNNKIAAILTQIDVPEFVLMPTTVITDAMEKVVGAVGSLVEIRRGRERIEGEVRVFEKMLGLEEKTADGEEKADVSMADDGNDDGNDAADAPDDNSGDEDDNGAEGRTDANGDDGDEDEDEEEEDDDQQDADADVEEQDDQAEEDAQGSPDDDEPGEEEHDEADTFDLPPEQPTTSAAASRPGKRSASVLSVSSAGSRAGAKRQKAVRK